MPVMKIDLNKLIDELKKEVIAIESSDATQADKTRRFNAAGVKFKNALYGDKRKFGSAAGQEKRISLNTYNTYLSRARKVFEEMGLVHHLLPREIDRMKKRYPGHAEAIDNHLARATPAEIRIGKKELEKQLSAGAELRRTLRGLDYSKPATKRKIDLLKNDHALYADDLVALLGSDAAAAYAVLENRLAEVDKLLADLADLKVNHEILYALRMEKSLRETHTDKKESALSTKKRNTVAIHFPNYIQRVFHLLTNPTVNVGSTTMFALSPLTFGLCAATGRRPIEILIQGQFKKLDSHRLLFNGQAKKRTENDDFERVIYTLIDADVVLNAIAALRALPQAQSLLDHEVDDLDVRSKNAVVNGRVASPINTFAKQFFKDESRVLKDTRAIYARICYELWFKVDPRWKTKDDDVFFAELLGHEDETTQMHYKSFKVFDCNPEFVPVESKRLNRAGRLERLSEFDGVMSSMSKGDSAENLHQRVKKMLADNPALRVTQNYLFKETGAYRPLIERYLETCASALDIERMDNGRWRQVDESEPDVFVMVKDDQPEQAPAPQKPRVTSHKDGEQWVAVVSVGGLEIASATAEDRMQAQRAAWEIYQTEIGD